MTRWLALISLLIIADLIVGVILTRAQVFAAPEQPIAYSHQSHVEAGVQGLFCHTSALRSDVAGIPSVEKCLGCHTVIATDKEAVQTLTSYWERGEPIALKRVNQQPHFVYFSHQAHLGAGMNFETCHGDVGARSTSEARMSLSTSARSLWTTHGSFSIRFAPVNLVPACQPQLTKIGVQMI